MDKLIDVSYLFIYDEIYGKQICGTQDMVKLTDKLLEVSNKSAEPSKNYSMDKICRGLIRLTNSRHVYIYNSQTFANIWIFVSMSPSFFCCSEFSCIMVPLQSSLTVTLPASSGCSATHNAFPGFQPTIETFEDKVVYMYVCIH